MMGFIRSKSKTLYIHVGTDKTGSTALQSFLSLNFDSLSDRSVRYLNSGRGGFVNHNALYMTALEGDHKKWHAAYEELRDANENIGIISFEGLYHLDSNALEEIKKIFKGITIKIVVYLRRQSDMVRSGVAQRIKQGTAKKISYEYERDDLIAVAQDYNKILDKFSAVFGNENIIPRVYEKSAFVNGNLFDDFTSILERQFDWLSLDVSKFKQPTLDVNPSLDVESIAILDRLDSLGIQVSERQKIVSLFLNPNADSKSTFIKKATADFIDKNFEEPNARLSKKWFDRDRLFDEPSKFVFRKAEPAKLAELYLRIHDWLPYLYLKPWKGFNKSVGDLLSADQMALSTNAKINKAGTAILKGVESTIRFLLPARGEDTKAVVLTVLNVKDVASVTAFVNKTKVECMIDEKFITVSANETLKTTLNGWVELCLHVDYLENVEKKLIKVSKVKIIGY